MNQSQLLAQQLTLRRSNWSASFDFSVPTGSWTTLLGPSGAGKTTLLELVAGFETPTTGELLFNGENLLAQKPAQRSIAYVFQQNALFPSLTADENLLLALHDSKLSATDKRTRITTIARRVGMERRLHHRPGELSGGELARMNLARALLRPARLLLLDEPFASLDTNLRREMHGLVRELHTENNLTTLCVTHHVEDALLFADRLLLFFEGRIVAGGTPADLLRAPPNLETARILDAGALFECDGTVHFVPKNSLTCSANKAQDFTKLRAVTFSQWKQAELAEGVSLLVCLQTGRSFQLDAPAECNGTLYYDEATARAYRANASLNPPAV
jgi:ABC-type Fe3+/spermidine/putrescine transport system ATPase subunit